MIGRWCDADQGLETSPTFPLASNGGIRSAHTLITKPSARSLILSHAEKDATLGDSLDLGFVSEVLFFSPAKSACAMSGTDSPVYTRRAILT
eukprot:2353555-Rhodomonas_salina.1